MDYLRTQPAPSASASASGVSSGAESHNAPGKTRSACNRCHSQKLRCVRNIGQVSCERCLRLRTSCRFGPRAPRASLKSPQRAAAAQAEWQIPLSGSASIPTPNLHADAMIAGVSDSEWLFSPSADTDISEGRANMPPDLCYPIQDYSDMQDLCWSGVFSDSRNVNQLNQGGSADLDLTRINKNIISQANSLPSPGTPDFQMRTENDRLGTPPPSAVRDLANLNVALYECATQLPCMHKAGVDSPSNCSGGSRKMALFAIDDLFRLTGEFINVVKCLSPTMCETGPTLSSMDPEQLGTQPILSLISTNQQLSQRSTQTDVGPPSRSFSHLDEATMHMVISCHCRLIEIYVALFHMMQACVEYSLAPRLGKDWAIVLPRLQFG
ncbi:hypothetical protein V1519DRAFT_477652, partial [Lipomyces tetrasporus]